MGMTKGTDYCIVDYGWCHVLKHKPSGLVYPLHDHHSLDELALATQEIEHEIKKHEGKYED